MSAVALDLFNVFKAVLLDLLECPAIYIFVAMASILGLIGLLYRIIFAKGG